MPSDLAPDEAVNAQDLIAMRKIVEKVLRNSLTDGMPKEVAAMSVMLSLVPEIERVAHDAAVVGARAALEDAAKSMGASYDAQAFPVAWLLGRAAAYTTDEETTT
jgi:hypothetical protein